MAKAAGTEVRDDYEVVRRSVPFKFKASRVPPGSRVVLQGNFDADFESGREADAQKGWNIDHPMTLSGDEYVGDVPDLIVGQTYEYKYLVTRPDGLKEWFPKGDNEKIVVGKAPAKSPSPTAGAEDVRKSIKGRVKGILEAAQSTETVGDLDALFGELEEEINELSISESITPLALEVLAEVIREMKTLPAVLRDQFAKDNPPKDIKELERRLRAGSSKYKRKVFETLRSNPEARKAFHLEGEGARYNPTNPLGKPAWNDLFNRLCNERDLGHLTEDLGKALDGVVNVPARSPELAGERRALLKQVAGRLTPEQERTLLARAKGALVEKAAEMPSDKAGKLLDALVQGTWVLGISSTWFGAAGGLALKGIAETVFGVGLKDLITAGVARAKGEEGALKHLGRQFAHHNLLSRLIFSKTKVTDVLKNAAKETLLRSIPGSPLLYKAEPTEGVHKSLKHEAGHSEKEGHEEHHADAEELIEKACQSSLS